MIEAKIDTFSIEAVVTTLRTVRESKAIEVESARAALTALIEELRQIDGMIAVGERATVRPNKPKKPAKLAKPRRLVGDGILDGILRAFHDEGGELTRRDLAAKTGLHITTVDKAIRQLRQDGTVRLARRERVNGSPRASIFYTLDKW